MLMFELGKAELVVVLGPLECRRQLGDLGLSEHRCLVPLQHKSIKWSSLPAWTKIYYINKLAVFSIKEISLTKLIQNLFWFHSYVRILNPYLLSIFLWLKHSYIWFYLNRLNFVGKFYSEPASGFSIFAF